MNSSVSEFNGDASDMESWHAARETYESRRPRSVADFGEVVLQLQADFNCRPISPKSVRSSRVNGGRGEVHRVFRAARLIARR